MSETQLYAKGRGIITKKALVKVRMNDNSNKNEVGIGGLEEDH
jgi:hypothetical protein